MIFSKNKYSVFKFPFGSTRNLINALRIIDGVHKTVITELNNIYKQRFPTWWRTLFYIYIYILQHGQTPLHLAAENDHSDVVKLFLKYRPELVTMANTVCHLYFKKSDKICWIWVQDQIRKFILEKFLWTVKGIVFQNNQETISFDSYVRYDMEFDILFNP